MGSDSGLGRAIREAREKAGVTLRQLAEKVGVSAPYLSDVEHGRRSIPKLPEVAKALGVPVESLEARSEVLTKSETDWINANPDIIRMLRDLRGRGRGPLRTHDTRKQRGCVKGR